MRRGVRAPSGVALGVILVAVGATMALGLLLGSPSPRFTSTWPAAVDPIARFVSTDRGLAFKHVVPVHLLAPATFDARVSAQDAPSTAAERADDARTAAELRALGLLNGRVNLARAEETDDDGSVLGYYDPDTKALYVRGRDLTPEVRVTIAHELTHALQDQYFGLNRLDNQAPDEGADTAVDALEEGDAVLDEDDYLSSLPLTQQRQEAAEESADGGPASTSSPAIIDAQSEMPYVLGPDLAGAIYATGGNKGLDAAFEHPPTSELDILDPIAYLRHVKTIDLHAPPPAAGQQPDGPSHDFGAVMTFLTLADRIPAAQALRAADGWGGGAVTEYRDAGRTCTKVILTGRRPRDTDELAAAFGQWAATFPSDRITTSIVERDLSIAACDPGATAVAGARSLDDALDLADQRDQNQINAIYAGATPDIAACVGDVSLDDTTLLKAESAQNTSVGPSPKRLQATVDHRIARLIGGCEPDPARGRIRPT